MPPLRIPKFGGQPVDQAHNAYSGADETPPEILNPDQEVYLIVRGTVGGVTHKPDRFGRLIRVQSVRVTHSLPADEESIVKVKAEIKRQQDEAAGQQSLDDHIDEEV